MKYLTLFAKYIQPPRLYFWGSIISAGASLLGGKKEREASTRNTELANIASAKEAALNRDFQAKQSATVRQRGVKDLRAAGLNPILAATAGSPAAGGATASQIGAQHKFGDLGASEGIRALGSGSARAIKRSERKIAKTNEQTAINIMAKESANASIANSNATSAHHKAMLDAGHGRRLTDGSTSAKLLSAADTSNRLGLTGQVRSLINPFKYKK